LVSRALHKVSILIVLFDRLASPLYFGDTSLSKLSPATSCRPVAT
jgi:hypothetical protein